MTTSIFPQLQGSARFLLEAQLAPVQGTRFQPTGFPDLGAAEYRDPAGTGTVVLVESAQSMANRLETAIWDDVAGKVVPVLTGMSYVVAHDVKGQTLTSSLLEAHRLNSPYILDAKLEEHTNASFLTYLKDELSSQSNLPVNPRLTARVVLKYDANAVLHGIFFARKELAGGRLRMTRLLSAFIEAQQAQLAVSGGVKNDRIDPSGDTSSGHGNVPFSREEYASNQIKAYFNLDLARLHAYGLPQSANDFLIALAFYKIRRFMRNGLRLRTACDFEVINLSTPYEWPTLETLEEMLPTLISSAQADGCFADPPVTSVIWGG